MYEKVGVIPNTHGIKGEVRILSNFELKDVVFKQGNNLYIGKNKEKVTINSTRLHKQYILTTFKGINNINDVLKYKGEKVYFLRGDLKLNEDSYLESDLINMEAFYNNKSIGVIKDIINNNNYKILDIENTYIPLNNNFIDKVDLKEKKVYLKNVEGLINEN